MKKPGLMAIMVIFSSIAGAQDMKNMDLAQLNRATAF
jgi:hypothetical protein